MAWSKLLWRDHMPVGVKMADVVRRDVRLQVVEWQGSNGRRACSLGRGKS